MLEKKEEKMAYGNPDSTISVRIASNFGFGDICTLRTDQSLCNGIPIGLEGKQNMLKNSSLELNSLPPPLFVLPISYLKV